MGVTPQAAAQWEKSNPAFDHLKLGKLSAALRVDTKWFLKDDDDLTVPEETEFYFTKFNRVPLILRDEALLFSLFRSSDGGFTSDIQSLEPTVQISNSSFAIIIENDDEIAHLSTGDIGIFDTEITASDDDIVMTFSVEDGDYRGRLVKRRDIKGDTRPADKLYNERNKFYHGKGGGERSVEGTVVLAVLVELRKLRPL